MKQLLPGWLRRKRVSDYRSQLHSAPAMRAIIERERQRSDRAHTKFCVLTLTLAHGDSALQAKLEQIVIDRIRATDEAGMMERRQIGILLPDTTASGAWKLAEDICAILGSDSRQLACEVYAHPTIPPKVDNTNGTLEEEKTHDGVPARSMQTLFCQRLPLWKRAIDVAGAGTALLLISPVMLVTAALVKITSPGPVFYRQLRDGLGGQRFWIYKFRTMQVNADAMKAQLRASSEQDGPAFKLKNDPRVTPLGRFLRRSCIDELPQLFNVLMGQMSVVGPRPLCSREAEHCKRWERRRFDVTPGLTCEWQVHGGTKVTFVEWMRMDLRYVRSRSFWKDLRLIVLTVPSIIRRDGVY